MEGAGEGLVFFQNGFAVAGAHGAGHHEVFVAEVEHAVLAKAHGGAFDVDFFAVCNAQLTP